MSVARPLLFLLFVLVASTQVDIGYAATKILERKKQLVREEQQLRAPEGDMRSGIESGATLNDYIRAGLQNNPGLKAAFYQWKAAFKKIAQESSLPDPYFTYTEYIDSVETRIGPQERAYSVKQTLPLPDKLWLRKDKAFKASEAAFHDFEKMRLELVYSITETYYEYAYLRKAILLMEENIALLKNFESVVQAKYRSALAENQDLLKVQVELGKLENDLLSLRDLRHPLVAGLNALLNLPPTASLAWPDESLEEPVLQNKYDEVQALYARLKKDNPELRSLTQRVAQSKDALKIAHREYFPDLTVGFTQIDTGDALNPSIADSGDDARMLTFSVNVPLWFNRLHAGVEEARSLLTVSNKTLENKEQELVSRVALVYYKLADAQRQSRLYKDALLPKARQSVQSAQAGYEAGRVDFLTFIDAQRVFLNFQLAYYRHTTDFYQRLAELQSLLGEMVEY